MNTHYELELNGLINKIITDAELEFCVSGYYSYAICTGNEKEILLSNSALDFDDLGIESNHLSRSFYMDGDVLFQRDVKKLLSSNIPEGQFIIAHSCEDGFFELDNDFDYLPSRFWHDGKNQRCIVFEYITGEFCLTKGFKENNCEVFSNDEYLDDEIGSIVIIDYYDHMHQFKRNDTEFIFVLENDQPEDTIAIKNLIL